MLGNFNEVILQLEQQRAAIDKAIAALREFDEGTTEATTPVRSASTRRIEDDSEFENYSALVKKPVKRKMSAAGRKAIAEASKKRWAKYNREKRLAGQ
jgi:pyruvate/2-oxoacid:ferredoxin oxidoreductase beta subunit